MLSWSALAFDTDDLQTLLSSGECRGCDLRDADLTHLNIDRDLEFVDLRGVLLEEARFADGRRCGPLPEIGGWGCSTP